MVGVRVQKRGQALANQAHRVLSELALEPHLGGSNPVALQPVAVQVFEIIQDRGAIGGAEEDAEHPPEQAWRPEVRILA